jgi:hypothetical protein
VSAASIFEVRSRELTDQDLGLQPGEGGSDAEVRELAGRSTPHDVVSLTTWR